MFAFQDRIRCGFITFNHDRNIITIIMLSGPSDKSTLAPRNISTNRSVSRGPIPIRALDFHCLAMDADFRKPEDIIFSTARICISKKTSLV